MNTRRYSKFITGLIISLILFSLVISPVKAANTAQMLQFTYGGHALGFAPGGMYTATGIHALHVDFVGANSVQPQADSPVSIDGKTVSLGHITYANIWNGFDLQIEASLPFSPVQKVMPVWKVLLLVYHNIDANYTDSNGIPRHLTHTMPQNEILEGMQSFRQYPAIAYDFSDSEAFIQYDIVHITRPINSLTSMGTNLWWASPSDTRQELDLYAPQGTYDSILVLWPQTNFATGQQIPSGGWGLAIPATSWSNNATYATVANAPSWMWNVQTVGEIWLHEWLHGVCDFYANKGIPMPSGNADGGGSHGYVWSSTTGWASYYRDLMTGRVLENGSYKGVTANAWRSGTILAQVNRILVDYFYSDTTSSYLKTGTVVWQNAPSEGQYITLGNSVASDNKMYIPANLHDNSTITGRLFIPATGVGIWDNVAIALSNDEVEYWATLAYGTQLVEKNNIAIMRNDVWGDLYPLPLSSGWYTVKVLLDNQNNVLRMKTWADGDNEPVWQVSHSLDSGWEATQVGFRHYGQGTRVDDLLVVQTTTDANEPPVTPTIISPSGTISDIHPSYNWNTSSGATSYRLAVWSMSSASFVILTDIASSYCTGEICTYHPATTLADGNYRFKVLASDAAGSSPYSAWMDFTLNTYRIYLPLVIR